MTLTRSEDDAVRREIYHADYMRRRDKRLAYAKQYAKDHREHINAMQRERRRKEREGRNDLREYHQLSTAALEGFLPLGLKMQKTRLRDEYLAIHISERPPYDYFLRCKTIEYYQNYERREQQFTTTAVV